MKVPRQAASQGGQTRLKAFKEAKLHVQGAGEAHVEAREGVDCMQQGR